MHQIADWVESVTHGAAIPFLIVRNGMPKLNTARVWEALMITGVPLIGTVLIGWAVLVPEIQANTKILEHNTRALAEQLKAHNEIEKYEKQFHDKRHEKIERSLERIHNSIDKIRQDHYQPKGRNK
ncbi:MAG: hypothetical protein GY799_25410 [Desulfobulbaceae bacterium]|nr:hypothetical protein [Desulfobulbaceae bacterium]